MSRFENFKKGTKKITEVGALATGLGIGMVLGGQETSAKITKPIKDNFNEEKNNSDSNKEVNPNKYDLSKTTKLNLEDLDEKKSLNNEVVQRIMIESLKKTRKFKEKNFNSGVIDSDDNQKNFELSNLEKKYLESSPDFFAQIEAARQDVEKLISSNGYLEKLKEEFNCSLSEAKKHQEVRLNNVKLSNYIIESQAEVQDFYQKENKDTTNFSALCYDTKHDNMIHFSYDYYTAELEKADQNEYGFDLKQFNMYNLACHEFLHKATRRNLGLSVKASKLLVDSFETDTVNISSPLMKQYLLVPTERYVRIKILELDLQRLGIKKVGENFTYEHCQKLYDLIDDKKLGPNSIQFIYNTKYLEGAGDENSPNKKNFYELYKKLLNEIAEVDNKEKNNNQKDFYNPDWNYNQPEPKV